jgi:DNA-binding NarL/FixJ family response regulator
MNFARCPRVCVRDIVFLDEAALNPPGFSAVRNDWHCNPRTESVTEICRCPRMTISVSIIEEHKRIRDSLEIVINASDGMCCSHVFGCGEEALDKLPLHWPDVLLIGTHLPGMSGIECAARLKVMNPQLRMLMLADEAESDQIVNCFRAGANGCLSNRSHPSDVIDAILELCNGGSPMSRAIARTVVQYLQQSAYSSEGGPSFSKREYEILILLSKGYQYKEIADSLSISVPTVRTHLRNIYRKLNVRSRTEAVVKFLSKRLF